MNWRTSEQYESCSNSTSTINLTFKMMKLIVVLAALVAISAAKPALVSAPLVAAAPAPIVTATSSQYYHRINSGLAAYVAAPAAYVAPAAAPYVAAPYVASPYAAPYVAASAPLIAY